MLKQMFFLITIIALSKAIAFSQQSKNDILTQYVMEFVLLAEKNECIPFSTRLYNNIIKALDIRVPGINQPRKVKEISVFVTNQDDFLNLNAETFKYRNDYILKSKFNFRNADLDQKTDQLMSKLKKIRLKNDQDERWYKIQDAFTECIEKRNNHDTATRSFECVTRMPMKDFKKMKQ